MPEAQDVHISMRIPQALADRLDAVQAAASQDPTYAALGGLGRSAVIRLALTLGVEALEKKHGTGKPPPPKRK